MKAIFIRSNWLESARLRAAVWLVLLLTWTVTSSECVAGCNRRWCKYSCMQCMNSSVALAQWKLASVHGCVLKASSSPDDLVVEWNKQTGVCSLFHYQHVCRLMQAVPDGAAIGDTSHCSCYRTGSLVSCAASLNAHLLGVWLAGGSNRFSNLVCQSEPTNYRLIGFNLQWTEEGASFDGVSSYALLNDSRFVSGDPGAEFTLLMRLKRDHQTQGLLEFESCSNPQVRETSLLALADGRLYFRSAQYASTLVLRSEYNLLSSSSDTFINIAVTVGASVTESKEFYQGSFVPTTFVTSYEVQDSCNFVSVGRVIYGSTTHMLNGTVSAIAIANSSMTEQEIRDFFALLP